MAFANLVRVLSATTGTGTLTLASAVTGFLTPSQAGMVDGSTYSYAIEADYATVGDDLVPTSREVGTGVYTVSGGTLTRSVLNSTNSNALLNLAGDAQVIVTPNALDFVTRTGPTFQSLTSGTGATYNTPAGVKWIEVFMVGGGGGGGGASSTSGTMVTGSAGGTSTFNAINAAGGSPGGTTGTNFFGLGGAGGTGGTGTATRRQPGGPGTSGVQNSGAFAASQGGSSYFGGGAAGTSNSATTVGTAAAVNTGAGGSGAINITGGGAGGGGGAGEFVYLLINNPAATYTYTVGTSGAGGVSTTNGGAGGTGFIFVIEHYNY